MPTFPLVTPGGTTLDAFELDDDETEPGSIIRRPGQPDRRVIGLLADEDEDEEVDGFDVLIVERV